MQFFINMDAMRGNIAKDTKIMAVIKADGYGHGAVEIAETIEKLDYLYGYAVATVEEGLILRNHGIQKPILDLRICVPGSVCGYDQSGHPSDRIYQRDGRKSFPLRQQVSAGTARFILQSIPE